MPKKFTFLSIKVKLYSKRKSQVDPEFLKKIKRKTELSKLDQEVIDQQIVLLQMSKLNCFKVVRLIGQHLCDVGLRYGGYSERLFFNTRVFLS